MKLRFLPAIAILLSLLAPAARGSYVAKYAAAGTRQTQVTGVDGATIYTLDNLVDTTASHTVTGTGTAPSALFDGKFSGNNGRWYSNASSNYVSFAFDAPTTVNAYAIYNGNSQYSNPSRAPKTWTLSGSPDGEAWTIVDSQSDETEWAAGELRVYTFQNSTAYTYYKLNVTAQNGDSYVQIHELEFYNFASFSLSATGSADITPSSFDAMFSLLCDGTADCSLRYGTSPDNLSSTISLGALAKGAYTNSVTGLDFDTTYWWSVRASNGSETLDSSTNSVRTSGAPVLGTATATTDGNAVTFFAALTEAAMGDTVQTTVTVSYGTSANDLSETVLMGSATVPASFSQIVSNLVWGTTYYYAATATATINERTVSTTSPTNSFKALWDSDIYVNLATENAAAPYSTPETAAKTIATALATAGDGATIHVAPGRYNVSSPITINKAVHVSGDESDPSRVVVSNTHSGFVWGSSNRCFGLNNADACISGLSLENGYSYGSAGNLLISSNGGTVSNCIIRGGVAREANQGGSGANVCISGPGLVTHCTIVGGQFDQGGNTTGSSSVFLDHANARLENCLVDGYRDQISTGTRRAAGVTVNKGRIVNCTVVNCYTTAETGGSFSGIKVESAGIATNCVSVGNHDGTGTLRAFLSASGSRLVNCAYDRIAGETNAISGMVSPVVGTAAEFFPHYADDVPYAVKYRPKSGGLLADKGADYEPMALYDLSGVQKRKIGSRVDIGCYEANAAGTMILIK